MHSENDTCEPRWGLAPETRSPLREWLCVDKLEMCCPQDHYGPKCQPCGVLGLGDKVRCQDNNCLRHFFTLSVFIRCAVAMESVKEVELARGMVNALATRYFLVFFLPPKILYVTFRNMGVKSAINAVGITMRASEMKLNFCVRRVIR